MEVVVMGRRGGKTTALLEWMRAAPEGEERVMVCTDHSAKLRMRQQNPDIEPWRFVVSSPFEFDRLRPKANVVYCLDDADWYLARLVSGGRIGALSLTRTVEPWEQAALDDPEVRPALDGALGATREELVSRGSFLRYAEDPAPEGTAE